MRISRLSSAVAILAGALLLPTLAQAHPGHDFAGFVPGALHPLTGLDHLLAMVAVGLWAAQRGGRYLWAVPATFVGTMALGALLGAAGIALPIAETGIVLSLLVVGLLVASAARLPMAAALPLVAVCALCHGVAHGAELPASGSAVAYGIGFLAMTAALHGLGLAAARLAGRLAGRRAESAESAAPIATAPSVAVRLAGATVAVAGLVFAAGL